MSEQATINLLREEGEKQVFLRNYSEAHPDVTDEDIDLAFVDAMRDVTPSDSIAALERRMDERLGLAKGGSPVEE